MTTTDFGRSSPVGWATLVFFIAIAARVIGAQVAPGIHHPDEVFQSLEQAHRVVFGYGFVPWEFEHGIRSWLLPGAIAGLMQFSRFFGEGPDYYLPVVQTGLSALGAGAVVCIFLWCHRLFGFWPSLLAALLTAFAPILLYFGPRALTEVVAGHLLVIGLYLAMPDGPAQSRARIALAGLLLGLAIAIRLQVAPAVAVIGLYALWRWPFRLVVPLVAGGLVAGAIAGVLDWWTWGTPFLSYWNNFSYNIGHGVAAHFGEEPWFQYPALTAMAYGGALAVLLPLMVLGGRAKPLFAAIALAVFAAHQPISHKEFRFLYPMIVMLDAMVALGFAQVLSWAAERAPRTLMPWEPGKARLWLAAAFGLFVLFIAGRIATFMIIPDQGMAWLRQRDYVQAALHVSGLPGVCGIGGFRIDWGASGGYVHLHQPVPYHDAMTLEVFRDAAPAFNTILFDAVDGDLLGIPSGSATCFGKRCVFQRPGSCVERPVATLRFQPPQIRDMTPVKRLWPPASFPRRAGT